MNQICSGGVIQVDGDRATARWTVSELFQRFEGQLDMFMGTYEDQLVCTADGWRFAQHAQPPSPGPVGRQDSPHLTQGHSAMSDNELAAAWRHFHETVERVRADALVSDNLRLDPQSEESLYRTLMQATAHAHSVMMGPDPQNPVLLANAFYDPYVGNLWMLPNPDFRYRMAFVDGAGVYCLRIHPGASPWITITAMSDIWGMPVQAPPTMRSLADFQPGPDGTYEIILSAERQLGNWLPLHGASRFNFLNLRSALPDWKSDGIPQFELEVVQRAKTTPSRRSIADTAARIRRGAAFVEFSFANFVLAPVKAQLASGGVNQLVTLPAPGFSYVSGIFCIQPDEVLLIELNVPQDAHFWGLQLGDIWSNAIPYGQHQCSLNATQTNVDPDGRIRFVIAQADPGVANWLDTAGNSVGLINLRTDAADPSARITGPFKLADLGAHLPETSRYVTPAERAETLRRRDDSVRRLYGY